MEVWHARLGKAIKSSWTHKFKYPMVMPASTSRMPWNWSSTASFEGERFDKFAGLSIVSNLRSQGLLFDFNYSVLYQIFCLQEMQLTTDSSAPSICWLALWWGSWICKLKSYQLICFNLHFIHTFYHDFVPHLTSPSTSRDAVYHHFEHTLDALLAKGWDCWIHKLKSFQLICCSMNNVIWSRFCNSLETKMWIYRISSAIFLPNPFWTSGLLMVAISKRLELQSRKIIRSRLRISHNLLSFIKISSSYGWFCLLL